MDTWPSPHTGFDWASGGVTIHGKRRERAVLGPLERCGRRLVDALKEDYPVNADVTVPGPEALLGRARTPAGFDGRWLPDASASADRRYVYPIRFAGRTFLAAR